MKRNSKEDLRAENASLRSKLEEAEEALHAIKSGEVEALVIQGKSGPQIYTLESATTASNRLRGEALAQVSDVVIAVDNNGRITFLNNAAERQYGYLAEDVLGCKIQEVYKHQWLGPDDEANAVKSLRQNGEWRGKNILTTKNGAKVHVESMVTVLRDGQGEPYGMLAVIRDMAERKRAEEASAEANERLAALSEQLRQSNERLEARVIERTAQLRALAGELTQSEERERRRIADILHDNLQQLLFAARLHLDILRKDENPKSRRKIEQRIEQLINDSIDISRNLSHELSLAVLHEAGLAAGLSWLGKWMEQHHRLTVRIHADEKAEPMESNIKVVLFQSTRELLFNIIKHSGVTRAEVRMSTSAPDQIEIMISDKGKGFDPAQTGFGGGKGTGFGLFAIRERLQLLGGQMEIESSPGEGSRFRLVAPLAEPSKPEVVPEPRKPVIKTSHRNGKTLAGSRIRLLLVDDHKIMRSGLSALLEQQPELEVIGLASDGQEAIEKVEKLQPDLVIMDVNMPRMNGIESTRRITQSWPDVKVIGLTMHSDMAHRDAMRKAGAMKCLVKSGPSQELIRAIRATLPSPSSTRRRSAR